MTADHSDAEDRQPGRDMVEAIASYVRGSANPLTSWLLDEAAKRGHDKKHLANTPGSISIAGLTAQEDFGRFRLRTVLP